MMLRCTEADWNPMGVGAGKSLLAERSHSAVEFFSTCSQIKKPIHVEATPAGQRMMHQGPWASIEVPTARKELHLKEGLDHKIGTDEFLNAAILEEMHEPSLIQSARHASSAITSLRMSEGIPTGNPGAGPHAFPPETSFVPIPNLLTRAETGMISGISQAWDESQVISGWDTWHSSFYTCEGNHHDEVLGWRHDDEPGFHADMEEEPTFAGNCCPSKLQQFVGAGLREEGWEKIKAATSNESVYDNASFKSTPCKHGVTLMLSNLPRRTKFSYVVALLKEHGCYKNLMSFHMPTHSSKHKFHSRGYIFVRFDCCDAAVQCFKACHGRYFSERKQCVVKWAHKQLSFVGEVWVL